MPFDVDVGADAAGRAVAVYSRCPGEIYAGVPVEGCDVYRLLLDAGLEHKLRRVSTSRASESIPSIWRGGIAYVSSTTPHRRSRILYLRPGARRPVSLYRGRMLAEDGRVGSMDLTSKELVFTWASGDSSQLWRVPLTGRRGRVLATGFVQEGNADQPVSPSAAPVDTLWVRVRSTPCNQTTIVSDHRGRRRATAPTTREIRALARDGTTLYAITSAPAPCSVPSDVTLVRLAPPDFTPTE